MEIRKVYAPYSKTGEQVGQTPLEGYVDVNQAVYPAVNTGIINENGEWIGFKSSDKQFLIDATHESVANGATVLSPQATPDYIDMTGFNDLFIALKPSTGGNVAITAVMAPATNSYANLSPIDAAATLRGNVSSASDSYGIGYSLVSDTAESLTVDVWNIFSINGGRLANQKLLQFKITNNSGGASDIDFAYLRVV